MATKTDLAKQIVIAAEVMGTELSPRAAEAMAHELASYPHEGVVSALRKCTREVNGKLTLAAIIARIDDGHIGADQAWAMCPTDEAQTVVWTDEMAEAFGVVRRMLDDGDKTAARMAFRDTYNRLVQQARDSRSGARWSVSLGHDANGRERPVLEAVRLGRIPAEHAQRYLPSQAFPMRKLAQGESSLADLLKGSLKQPLRLVTDNETKGDK
jgi:hypothetical protein